MKARNLKPSDRVVLSFVFLILLGTILLHLPWCSSGSRKIHLRDSFFTATSAVCVTGLVVKDTGGDFTLFGQAVILCLIQVGGLGILTLSNWLLLSLGGKKTDVETRLTISQTHGSLPRIEPTRLLKEIMLFTFACETTGAVVLFARFSADHSLPEALWLAVFHAVSAFCNAGFSLFTDSLVAYRSDPVVNVTMMALIVLGGLGFLVFSDLIRFFSPRGHSGKRRRLSYHTRVVLTTTVALLAGGTVVFFLLESRSSMRGFGLGERFLASLFLSATSRTAGFNTLDTASLGNATLCLLILLMAIGASPGSTGGGMKTTSFTLLLAILWSRSRGRERVEWMGRSIPNDLVAKAVMTSAAFITLVLFSVTVIEWIEIPQGTVTGETRGLFIQHLFEVVSAIGTVGLSTGVTADLQGASQVLLAVLMFTGRLGPLLIANSLIGKKRTVRYTLPEDHLMVG